MIKTTIRHPSISLIAKLGIILSTAFSSVSLATAGEKTLITATQLKLNTFQISTRFHQLTLHEGDTAIQSKLEEDIEALRANRSLLETQDAPESKEAIKETIAISEDYAHFALSNEMASEGYTSQYAINDLHKTRLNLITTLNKIIEKELEVIGESSKYELYKAATLMQKMTSQYVRRANSTGGAGVYVANEENLETPDVMAQQFTELLSTLMKTTKNDPNIGALIRNIDRKWRFIKPSFEKYNQNTVPYLVTKYCDTIVTKFAEAADKI
ncbi:hypothetical protein [Litoribacillus peritrichatus]|uniref:Uncharacterized protein n=1 Tax=Litoribacillus peritrichatus TaxID=718191 RepID=A0ABP7LZK2_9GAMM